MSKFEKQTTDYTCGVAAIRNCLVSLDTPCSQLTIKRIALSCKEEGTGKKGIIRAIKHYGHQCKEFTNKTAPAFLQRLKQNLKKGRKLILLTEHELHWISLIDYINKKFIVIEPERKLPLKTEVTAKQLTQWCNNYCKRKKIAYFSGIIIYPKINKIIC